jgi:hypothetical protein
MATTHHNQSFGKRSRGAFAAPLLTTLIIGIGAMSGCSIAPAPIKDTPHIVATPASARTFPEATTLCSDSGSWRHERIRLVSDDRCNYSITWSHVLSGLNAVISEATWAVFDPRSFWTTTPSWLIMNVITPEER